MKPSTAPIRVAPPDRLSRRTAFSKGPSPNRSSVLSGILQLVASHGREGLEPRGRPERRTLARTCVQIVYEAASTMVPIAGPCCDSPFHRAAFLLLDSTPGTYQLKASNAAHPTSIPFGTFPKNCPPGGCRLAAEVGGGIRAGMKPVFVSRARRPEGSTIGL